MFATLLRQNVMPHLQEPRKLLRVLSDGRRDFTRKIAVDFTVRGYRVKTVETERELRQILALRRSVFHYEFAGKWLSLRSDRDCFDAQADHLAIFDEKTGAAAGVYRLIPSATSRSFYSSTEFDISPLLQAPGLKLELSRACIGREYRNGVVIHLLWRGLAEYAKASGAELLFGLSSITTTDPEAIARIHQKFVASGATDLSFGIHARPKYAIANFDKILAAASTEADATVDQVPPLFKTYLKAGAKVCSQPVIDQEFNCADWLTVLSLKQLTEAFGRKFMRD